MWPKRGRPGRNVMELITTIILENKENLVTPANTIRSKLCSTWLKISNKLDAMHHHPVTPNALYTMVVKNVHGLEDKILNPNNIRKNHVAPTEIENNGDISISSDGEESTSDNSMLNKSGECDNIVINIIFMKSELDELIISKQYSRKESTRTNISFREFFCLKPGEWQCLVTDKLWQANKTQCAFNFKRNKVFNKTINILGKCNCGAVINGKIADYDHKREFNVMKCEISKGTGTCGKRYLRRPERLQIGQLLCEKNITAEVYRANQANKLMSPGDPEPPHLYTGKALRSAKKEFSELLCLDKDPFTSLTIAQDTILKNNIHNLGGNSFFIHYWTSHQLNVYREYALAENSSIAIDATGSVVRKMIRSSKLKSKHIFLYECVINSATHPRVSVAQMLSERQTSNYIEFWLMEWKQTGVPIPKEVTCDSSKALLTAIVRAFTECDSVDEYAMSCWGQPTENCYIRIDVADFIKGYANSMKSVNLRIKRFYMHCIGQLILVRTLEDAKDILTSIIAIAGSQTEGHCSNGEPTACEVHKEKMKSILTDTMPFVEECLNSTDSAVIDIDLGEVTGENCWQEWAKSIQSRVLSQLRDEGDRDNAHYLPSLIIRVIRDFKWFPLWSCICQAKYGYGRIPASSAAVEADFNNIKTRVFGATNLPIRADFFVMRHLDYLNGRVKLVEAKNQANEMTNKPKISTNEQGPQQDINTSTCPACNRNDKPTGAHVCELCAKVVHVLEGCSVPFRDEDEGYGQKRICISCSKSSAVRKPTDTIRTDSINGIMTRILKDITNMQDPSEEMIPTVPVDITAILQNSPENISDTCSACRRGDRTKNAYTCELCKKSVHDLTSCSVPFEENEGCEEKRICVSCRRIPSPTIAHALDSGSQENWRGLAVPPPKKKGRYLQKNYSQNLFLTSSKRTKVPILKNGGCLQLRQVTLKCGKVTLIRTCGFDSVFQILLVAVINNIEFQLAISQVSTNEMFKMVLDVKKNGITKTTHHQRANILYDIVPKTNKTWTHNSCLLNCETTAGYLCTRLFKEPCSIKEISTCDRNCEPRVKLLPVLQLNIEAIFNDDFSATVENSLTLGDPKRCCRPNCTGTETTKITEIGPVIIFEIYNWKTESTDVELGEIPREIKMSTMDKPHNLRGLIHFTPPNITTRNKNVNAIGHFTAACLRKDGTWQLYDDTKKAEIELSSTFKANVQVIVYSL